MMIANKQFYLVNNNDVRCRKTRISKKKCDAASNLHQWQENFFKVLGILLKVVNSNYNYILPRLCIKDNELERNKGIRGNKQSP